MLRLLYRRDFSDNITIQTLVLSISIFFAFLITVSLFTVVVRGHMKNRLKAMKMPKNKDGSVLQWQQLKLRPLRLVTKNQVKDDIQIDFERELHQQKPTINAKKSGTSNQKNSNGDINNNIRVIIDVKTTTEFANNFVTNNSDLNSDHEIVHKEKDGPLEDKDEKDQSFEEQEETLIIGQETLDVFQPSSIERCLLFGFNNERRESAIIIT
ncbi:7390_t:CDS:2 [Ambispora leptoticha]|uniref:7390_t:CDS:1 n=1 Tax=Ambispora leptoticha TaxID=144679 RepID=A0A9N8Z8K5_9GLOM|nr:7390_t:CDS:2 [Ambispora leptoticha]